MENENIEMEETFEVETAEVPETEANSGINWGLISTVGAGLAVVGAIGFKKRHEIRDAAVAWNNKRLDKKAQKHLEKAARAKAKIKTEETESTEE